MAIAQTNGRHDIPTLESRVLHVKIQNFQAVNGFTNKMDSTNSTKQGCLSQLLKDWGEGSVSNLTNKKTVTRLFCPSHRNCQHQSKKQPMLNRTPIQTFSAAQDSFACLMPRGSS